MGSREGSSWASWVPWQCAVFVSLSTYWFGLQSHVIIFFYKSYITLDLLFCEDVRIGIGRHGMSGFGRRGETHRLMWLDR